MERLRAFQHRRVPAAWGLDHPGQIEMKMGVEGGRVLRIYSDMSHLPLGRKGPNADCRCKRNRLAAPRKRFWYDFRRCLTVATVPLHSRFTCPG